MRAKLCFKQQQQQQQNQLENSSVAKTKNANLSERTCLSLSVSLKPVLTVSSSEAVDSLRLRRLLIIDHLVMR